MRPRNPSRVANRGGKTLVTNAGSNGKFLAVMDLKVKAGRFDGFRYHLLPVFANLIEADRDMDALIRRIANRSYPSCNSPRHHRDPALPARQLQWQFRPAYPECHDGGDGCRIAFSSGFRWGTALLPGSTISREDLLAQTAITYPSTEVREITGAEIKALLEDKADNLFNPDPYLQQGGDMTRVGGMQYAIEPAAKNGSRIAALSLKGKPSYRAANTKSRVGPRSTRTRPVHRSGMW